MQESTQWVPKTSLRFNNLLEGLVAGSYHIQSYSVLQGKERVKSARVGDTEVSDVKLSLFPQGTIIHNPPRLMCDNMHGVLPTRETYPKLSV